MQQALEHAQGKRELRTTVLPDPQEDRLPWSYITGPNFRSRYSAIAAFTRFWFAWRMK